MSKGSWRKLLWLAIVLLLTGVVLPLLMVIGVLRPTFLLSFLSFGASVSGLFLGSLAVTWMLHERKGSD